MGETPPLLPPPMLLLIGGLPGTGKSTVAEQLAGCAGFEWIDTDLVRKELAGLQPTDRRTPDDPMYSLEAIQRVYDHCVERAASRLRAGARMIVSATFAGEAYRTPFVQLAAEVGVPVRLLFIDVEREEVRRRLTTRMEHGGDVSDADVGVYDKVAARWEELSPPHEAIARRVEATGLSPDQVLARVLGMLRDEDLLPAAVS